MSNVSSIIDKNNLVQNENNNVSYPSLNQGKKFKRYQKKINSNLEEKAIQLSGKEGFEGKTLTKQTNKVIDKNNYDNQQQIIDNLRKEYDNTLKDYNDLTAKISGNLTGYVNRVSSNNPYLNKVVSFSDGTIAYVTSQGVAKWIPSTNIWKTLNVSQTVQTTLNIPWTSNYNTPGTQINTNPPLISGTALTSGQSIGNEGSNIFVSELLPSINEPTYMGCFATSDDNKNMSFIGDAPPPASNASIQNGNFSQPVLSNNTYQYITGTSVPGWTFGDAVLLNNSTIWNYPMPYPGGNQCVSIQNVCYISTTLPLTTSTTYTITFSSCSRNCCNSPNVGNPINLQIYTSANAFISTVANFTAPINKWQNYSYTFTVPTSQNYSIFFTGTNSAGDQSTAIANVALNSTSVASGSYSYDDCKQSAITNGYQYFALQNVNTSNGLGYCAVSNSEPAVSKYGTATAVSSQIAIWSSNTANQPGNTAILSTTGSLQVLNSSGTAVYSSPASSANPGNFLGCYQDCSQGRGLPTKIDGWYDYSSCKSAADSGKWSYFGLQDTQPNGMSECWVGNDLSLAKSMGLASNCTQLNNITVGGGCSNAIYSTQSTGNYYLVLQDDGNMVIYRGTGPNDNQGFIWSVSGQGKTKDANPNRASSKGKYGQYWMSSGATLAPGDFIGSSDGKMALVMQPDGNLVLYAYKMDTNCQKIGSKMGGGAGANAAYDIGMTAVSNNMGKLAFVDSDSNLYTYPISNSQYTNQYNKIEDLNTPGYDIPGLAFANATVDSCKSACNNNTECAGFVFDNYNKICYPKNNGMYPYGGSSSYLNNVDVYIRNKQPATPPLGVSSNTSQTNTIQYQNYIAKGDIGKEYGLAKASSVEKKQLEQLQTKMDLLSKQITEYTDKFQKGTMDVENQSKTNVTGIQNYLTDLTDINKKSVKVAENSSGQVHNVLNDSDIVVLQKNYEYLFWSILAAGVVLATMNIVKK